MLLGMSKLACPRPERRMDRGNDSVRCNRRLPQTIFPTIEILFYFSWMSNHFSIFRSREFIRKHLKKSFPLSINEFIF
jgi:hypothetical protein